MQNRIVSPLITKLFAILEDPKLSEKEVTELSLKIIDKIPQEIQHENAMREYLQRIGAEDCSPTVICNINEPRDDHYTLLMLAARQGNATLTKRLLEVKADPNIRYGLHKYLLSTQLEEGYTALMYAAQNGQVDTVRTLIEAKSDLNITSVQNHATALSINMSNAAYFKTKSESKELKADVQASYKTDMQNSIAIAFQLLEAKADPTTVNLRYDGSSDGMSNLDHSENTVLHIAAKYGFTEILQAIIKSGVDLNTLTCKDGRTALAIALEHKQLASLDLLFKAKASHTTGGVYLGSMDAHDPLDEKPATILDIALYQGMSPTIGMLLIENNVKISRPYLLMRALQLKSTWDLLDSGYLGKPYTPISSEILDKNDSEHSIIMKDKNWCKFARALINMVIELQQSRPASYVPLTKPDFELLKQASTDLVVVEEELKAQTGLNQQRSNIIKEYDNPRKRYGMFKVKNQPDAPDHMVMVDVVKPNTSIYTKLKKFIS